uniref:Uncharacterized protein n=1 Tax=Anopheles albimanus TaxID=7167 RepID=A0A182FKA5_ANOAL
MSDLEMMGLNRCDCMGPGPKEGGLSEPLLAGRAAEIESGERFYQPVQ